MAGSSSAKTEKPKPKVVTITVNNREVELPEKDATGLEIKNAAGIPSDFHLYDPHGKEVGNDEKIKIHNNERFTAISGQDVS